MHKLQLFMQICTMTNTDERIQLSRHTARVHCLKGCAADASTNAPQTASMCVLSLKQGRQRSSLHIIIRFTEWLANAPAGQGDDVVQADASERPQRST
jgi:hypothetical protein